MIAEVAPGDLDVVFFTSGGAEANENATRLTRLATGRQKVLAAYRSYHGATAGAIALTGDPRRWPSEPSVPGVVHFLGPYIYRSSFGAGTAEEECERALAHLEEIITFEGSETVAGVILETVVGTNGILVAARRLPRRRTRALQPGHDIVMIADEVMSGFGRCGEWFAVDRWNVVPDLITFAKGVNSGYVPLGGVIINRTIAVHFREKPFPGGFTYSGHPLACAAAVSSIRVFKEEGLLEHARMLGEKVFEPGLRELKDPTPQRRRRARPRRLLGGGVGQEPRDSRDVRSLQRHRRHRGPDERGCRGMQGERPVALRAFQPDSHRAADQYRRRRRPPWVGDPGRGTGGRRPPGTHLGCGRVRDMAVRHG